MRREEDPLRDLFRQRVDEARKVALEAGGRVSSRQIASLARLARLVQIEHATRVPEPRRRWWLAAVVAGTLVVVSTLLFARVRETEIALDLELEEAGFVVSDRQVLTDVVALSVIGASGLRQVSLPDAADATAIGLHTAEATAVRIAATSNGAATGEISLAPIALPPRSRLTIQRGRDAYNYRLSLEAAGITLQVGVRGPVGIVVVGSPLLARDYATPRAIVLRAGPAPVDVMISGEFANGPTAGAGLVFGGDRKRVFVVTADHVVRRRSGEIAKNLRVRFRSQQDSALPARFTARADAKLDIAVLEVAGLEQRGVSYCEQPFDWLGQADALERGDAVYTLGHPNGMGWVTPVTSDRIVEVSGDTITFQSLFIAEGHSGGALLTEDAEVVGLIQAHQPPFGRARAIGTVLDTVKSWGYPVAVHRAGAAHDTLGPPGDLNDLRDLLIAGGCAIAREYDHLGHTPLHLASLRGNRAAVALLLEHGADVNQRQTHRGRDAALSFATSHPDIVSLLLKAGADVDQKDARSSSE